MENDAGADAASPGTPAPGGGRDGTGISCFAACQNTSISCQNAKSTSAASGSLILDGDRGCTGSLTAGEETTAITLDCTKAEVCTGTPPACVPATFSAFTFAYTPAGKLEELCTRD